ncbi:MAG: hypothetical protein Q8R70_12980, partial [Methanoregula sp.]|nr:hypothetical protein [Methanoregula sp.]
MIVLFFNDNCTIFSLIAGVILIRADIPLMNLPGRTWLVIMGLFCAIAIVLLCGPVIMGERSVSNLYFIPAGSFHFFSGIPPATPAPVPYWQISNENWGKANPVQNITRGEPLVISGTTNLPAGEKILVRVIPPGSDCRKNESCEFSAITKNASMTRRTDGTGSWSAVFNSTGIRPDYSHPGLVLVYSMSSPLIRYEQAFFVYEAPPIVPGAVYTYNGISPDRNITSLQVWVTGPSYAEESTVKVKPDGTFTFHLNRDQTRHVTTTLDNSPDYTMILHFPGPDHQNDLTYYPDTGWLVNTAGKKLFDVTQVRARKGNDGAELLTESIGQAGDTFKVIDLIANDPWISVDPVGEQTNTANFTITGSANIPMGVEILVQVYEINDMKLPDFDDELAKKNNY